MGAILHCLWNFQRMIVYPHGFFHDGDDIQEPMRKFNNVVLVTADGIQLNCYLIWPDCPEQSKGTVLMCHGNAMNHGSLIYHAEILASTGYYVFTLEYRGYGHNKGTPSESGLQRDGQAGFDYIATHPILSKKPIIIFGVSLGGAVAIDITSRNASQVTALMVENTFTSIPTMLRRKNWFLFALSFICTQRWNSQSKIRRLRGTLPILMLCGQLDRVIPEADKKQLWKAMESRPGHVGTYETFPWGGHCDTFMQPRYFEAALNFLERHVPTEAGPPSSCGASSSGDSVITP